MKLNLFRTVVCVAVLLFCASAMQAQLRYGMILGGSFAASSLDDAPAFSTVNRSGFRGGLTLEYQIPRMGLAFDASLLYNRFNSRLRNDADGSVLNGGRNCIEIPIHVKYKFWLPATYDMFAPMVLTGPSFMFNVDNRKDNAPFAVRRFQPGWDVGAGFDIINFIQIYAGYRFGLNNAVGSFNAAPDASLHTSGWFLSAAMIFDF